MAMAPEVTTMILITGFDASFRDDPRQGTISHCPTQSVFGFDQERGANLDDEAAHSEACVIPVFIRRRAAFGFLGSLARRRVARS